MKASVSPLHSSSFAPRFAAEKGEGQRMRWSIIAVTNRSLRLKMPFVANNRCFFFIFVERTNLTHKAKGEFAAYELPPFNMTEHGNNSFSFSHFWSR